MPHPFWPISELWKSLYAYDTVHHSWLLLDENVSKENELPRGLYGHTINVINGYVYLFGGTSGTFYFNTIYRLVHDPQCFMFFQKIFRKIFSEFLTWEEHLKRFDLYEKKKWETVFEDANDNSSNVPIGRYRHETAVYNDFLVVIGGGEQLRLGWDHFMVFVLKLSPFKLKVSTLFTEYLI